MTFLQKTASNGPRTGQRASSRFTCGKTSSLWADPLIRGSISTGQEFANTYAAASPTPASFKLGEFPIKGVRDTLMMMPTGARWEIFLPADQAFGNDPRSPVGPRARSCNAPGAATRLTPWPGWAVAGRTPN